jgi:hypothetical protein
MHPGPGTIPSKTFREAVLHLTGYRHQGFYGKSTFTSSRRSSMNEILQRVQKVEDVEAEVTRHQMRRNGVHLVTGTRRFDWGLWRGREGGEKAGEWMEAVVPLVLGSMGMVEELGRWDDALS